MKKMQLFLGAAIVAAGFTSCKNETEQTAEKNVDRYIVYVDSIERLDAAERSANWAAIEAEYDRRLQEADAALANMEKSDESRNRIEETKTRYVTIRTESSAGTNTGTATNAGDTSGTAAGGNAIAMALFGNADTSFAWVNKDNIRGVYDKMYETYKSNADNYTKEQHNQIKAWYEALDERKNVVEKEGLTEEDNEAIAKLKVKFAPLFKWERMTADGPEDDK